MLPIGWKGNMLLIKWKGKMLLIGLKGKMLLIGWKGNMLLIGWKRIKGGVVIWPGGNMDRGTLVCLNWCRRLRRSSQEEQWSA
jgi:hypothetical protein